MRFSVIIPTYNRGELIEATIQSVLNQSFSDFEIIVVDDGGADNTKEVIENINSEKIKYFWKENAERAAARNYGASKAKGEYITFLDSDDKLYSDFLLLANESLEEENDPEFFHQAYEVTDENENRISKPEWPYQDNKKNIARGNPLSCIGVFIKAQAFAKCRFNEDRGLTASEDWELWIRLIAKYGLKRDRRISAALIQHSGRSVLAANENQLRSRSELAVKYAFEDTDVQREFAELKVMIEAYWSTYVALHLALSGNSSRSWKYLKDAVRKYPMIIFSKRALVIIKTNIFKQ
ncbi:MAG: glycosyltransferase [Bacteroidia bacterium]|nr:glycosyltransferase [Bacteroidia bacterium]